MASAVFDSVLVTGGAGFVGSHLVSMILGLYPQARVTVIDNFLTGRRENMDRWIQNERVTFVEHDLTDTVWLEQFLQEAPHFSLILHFASPASPPRYQAEPVRTYLVNAFVTHVLAAYATRIGARLLFASTSEVYGDPLEHPQKETYWGNVNPNGLRSCYDESKRFGETVLGVHHRDFGGDMRIVRIFNTYGPFMDPFDGRVIPDFCLRILKNEPIQMFGDGTQTRSFCYVEDLVNGILAYAEKDGLNGETINIGNPVEFTLLELVGVLENMLGKKLEVEFQPLPSDDPKRRRPDISKAQQLLQWQPTISLEQGIVPTFAYFQNVIQTKNT